MTRHILISHRIPLADGEIEAAPAIVEARKLREAFQALVDPDQGGPLPVDLTIEDGPVHVGRPKGSRDRTPRKRKDAAWDGPDDGGERAFAAARGAADGERG